MRVGKLLKWWLLALAVFLVYAGADILAFPKQSKSSPETIRFEWSPDDPFEFIHAGGRVISAYGWGPVILLAVFGTGLVVTVLSILSKEDE